MRELVSTALGFIGIALVVVGMWFIFWPAAFIAAGVGVLFVSRGLAK